MRAGSDGIAYTGRRGKRRRPCAVPVPGAHQVTVKSDRKRGPSLERLRHQLAAVEARLLEARAERSALSREVQAAKARNGDQVWVPERERAQLARLEALNSQQPSPVPPAMLRAVFREVLSGSRALQSRQSVAYLGPEGTWSEQAAIAQFGSQVERLPQATIGDVFRAVDSGEARFGVVPIENSTGGMVDATLDAFVTTSLCILAERQLRIRHALLSRSAQRAGITQVAAHPQALAQCREWLRRHLPGAELREAASNAEAARLARTHKGLAAIAGREAAEIYGLEVVADGIQDLERNVTRFVVIGPERAAGASGAAAKSGKVSLLFAVKNEPGALSHALQPLARAGIDMLKIESRPMRERVWDYLFFVDVRGEANLPVVARAFGAMRRHCVWFRVLGSYATEETP